MLSGTHAEQAEVDVELSLGYMEEAKKFGRDSFDVVFNNICFNYGMSDRRFSRIIRLLVNRGGLGFVDVSVEKTGKNAGLRKIQYALYHKLGIKIGHPYPKSGKLRRLFDRRGIDILLDERDETGDRILFRKV